jgi:hypothetical protein
MLPYLSAVAVVVAIVLVFNLYKRFASDRIQQFIDRRRQSSRLVGRGELVDGNRHLGVALAVTQSTFFYENSDMEASLDLDLIEEIEYDTELATGSVVANGSVLRLRCHSQTFEFVVPAEDVQRWNVTMPPRQMSEAAAVAT